MIAAGLVLAQAALARAEGVHLELSRSVGPPSSPTRVTGGGFQPGEAVVVSFDAVRLSQVVARSDGSITSSLRIPDSALPGTHELSARGKLSGRSGEATFTVRVDWAMFRFSPAHTGYNRFENVLSVENVANLTVAWARETAAAVGDSSPAVVENTVYVADFSGTTYAVDSTSGAIRWQEDISSSSIASSPAVAEGLVFILASDHVMYALDADTGVVVWSEAIGGVFSHPIVSAGILYVNGTDTMALEAHTGETIWVREDLVGGTGPALAGGTLYVNATYHTVALDPSDGSLRWLFEPFGGKMAGSPAVSNGVVYVGGNTEPGGRLYAVDADTGDQLWQIPLAERVTSSPAVWNGVVYVGSADDHLYAVDAGTGEVLWTVSTGGDIESSPTVAGGVVYVGSGDGSVYAIDAESGDGLWSYATGAAISSSPAVVDGRVYIGAFDHHIYSFALPT